MAHAQLARDGVMAKVLRTRAAAGGVVLLAGNGHVRRDMGVPHWLGGRKRRVFAVAYLEGGNGSTPVAAFDAVARTAAAKRADACAAFEKRAGAE
jgi:uncharacterized iron-regulated protein